MQRARTQQAKDLKREAILEAALEEFYLRGFNAAKIEEIARRTGISKGTVYLYFESKDAMFEALIRQVAAPKVVQIEALLGSATSVTEGISALLDFAANMIKHSALPKVIKVIISDAFAFPHLVRMYRENIIDRALKALTELVTRGVQQQELQCRNPGITARIIIAPILLSVIWRVVFEPCDKYTELDIDALMQEHKSMLFRALTIDGGAQ